MFCFVFFLTLQFLLFLLMTGLEILAALMGCWGKKLFMKMYWPEEFLKVWSAAGSVPTAGMLLAFRFQSKSSSCSCSQEQRSNSKSQRTLEVPGKHFPIYGREKKEISWLQDMQSKITVILTYHVTFNTLEDYPDTSSKIEYFKPMFNH